MLVSVVNTYIQQCVPNVAPSTMRAIVAAESKGNNLALGINYGYKLKYQPQNLVQAKQWLSYLLKHGYNVDIGLAQINIKNVYKYGYHPDDMFDPCMNLKVAGKILSANYHRAYISSSGNKYLALLQAISAYNTGNYSRGFYNGYVQRVLSQGMQSDNLANRVVSNTSVRQNKVRHITHGKSLVYAKVWQ